MHRVRGIIVLGLAVACLARDAQSQATQGAPGPKSYRLEPTPKTFFRQAPYPRIPPTGSGTRHLPTRSPLAHPPRAPYHPA